MILVIRGRLVRVGHITTTFLLWFYIWVVGGIPHLLHIGITHLLQNTQNTIKLNHAQHSTTNLKPHHPNNK